MPTGSPLRLDQVFGVSLAISLEYEEAGRHQLVPSRVEDVQPDRIWVAMPMRGSMFVPLAIDTPVVAYIKHEDALYTLSTRVVGRQLQPYPGLELSPTGVIERHQRREHVRLEMMIVPRAVALLSRDGAAVPIAASIINVSAGGVLIRTREPIMPGQELSLNVELPPPGGVISSTLQVLRVSPLRTERGAYYEAGCVFQNLAQRDHERIVKFIFHLQRWQARRTAGRG